MKPVGHKKVAGSSFSLRVYDAVPSAKAVSRSTSGYTVLVPGFHISPLRDWKVVCPTAVRSTRSLVTADGARGLSGCAAAAEHMVNGNGPGTQEDQREGQRGRGKREFESGAIGRSRQSIVQVNFPDGDAQVDADG